ncbi:MAG: hypothetical protein U5M23_05555 [Marinagarivorans sp.]|nr:hypothetical protein [Marinagarivorans sp.]
MNIVLIISLLLGLAITSLLAVNFVNRQQTRRRLITQRAAQLRRLIAELEEMAATIEPLLESTQVPKVINDEIVHIIEQIIMLEPNNEYMQPALNAAKDLSEDLALEKRSCQLSRALSSDAQMARCKLQLNEAARLIRKIQLQGRLDALEAEAFVRELTWAQLICGVITFVNQGHVSLKQGDAVKAYGFYKNAQQALIATAHPDDRRHRFIREVSDILAGRRKALSIDLMPEADNNPEPEPEPAPAAPAAPPKHDHATAPKKKW